jgi:predicted nucleic acid-binding protein
LRSLDAIHVATAEMLVASGKALTAFVTYDRRLADTARNLQLPVEAPA